MISLHHQGNFGILWAMEAISHDQVKHIAHLSRLTLSDEEVTLYTEQLSKILDYASHLPELSHSVKEEPKLRVEEDAAKPYPNPQELLQNAVAMENGFVKVPAILDKGES